MKKHNFHAGWQFRKGLDNPMMSAFVGGAQEMQEVRIPYDSMIRSERCPENIMEEGIGYYTPENVEYEKCYIAPAGDACKVTYLEFEGVYGNAVLEVNGQVVKRHRFGFTGFTVKISDYLKYGQENQIKMTALNEIHPNGRYYTGTGIYRPVSLMVADPFHIVPDGVRITTLDADKEMASLEIVVRVQNENSGHRKGTIKTVIKGPDGRECGTLDTIVNLMSHDEISVRQRVYVAEPELWDTEHPAMYTYETILEDETGVLDEENGTFGIRTIKIDPLRGMQINGRTVKLKGGCIHSDNGPIGAVSLKDAEERRIRMLKDAGYNAVRTAHNPVSHALLDACDKYGMLVMEEYADAWTHPKPTFDYSLWMPDCWEEDLEAMIRIAYNHPSVIMYSIGNEIADIGTGLSAHWGRKYIEKIKQMDSYRVITNGVNIMMANLDKIGLIAADLGLGDIKAGEINNMMAAIGTVIGALNTHPISMNAIKESCDMLEVVGYNYAAHMYEMQHAEMPNRIFVGTETNPGELDTNWEIVKKNPYVIGDFSWTAWDYIGEPGIGRIEEEQEGYNVYAKYPWMLAYCGDFDITGYRRPVSYWREIVWGGRSHEPYLAVQRPENIGRKLKFSQWSWTDSIHSWTFPGYEGKKTVVEVYTDADETELFLNGKSLGRKINHQENKKYVCSWDTFYEPGILEAVAYIQGREVGRTTLATAKDAHLQLTVDKDEIKAASDELVFAEIEYRDGMQMLDLSANRTIHIEVSENLELLGSGSADPKTEEKYTDASHKIYEGRMVAVLRARKEPGDGFIKVTDDEGNSRTALIRICSEE